MKKVLRGLALSLTVVLLAVTLCGCNALDEMRELHALHGEDGNLTLNGEVYKPLPHCDSFAPLVNDDAPLVNVTSPDVPLLLSDMLAMQYLEKCDDGAFLWDSDTGTYYCREDRYDEVAAKINKGPVFTTYGYEYGYWNEEEFTYDTKTYLFTDEQADAFEQVFFSKNPTMLNQNTVSSEYLMDIWRYSADRLFREPLCSVLLIENVYFLYLEVDNDTAAFYRIPDNLSGVFADIVREYHSAVGYDLYEDTYTDDAYVYNDAV